MTPQICLDNAKHWGRGEGSRKLSIVTDEGDHFNKLTFKRGIG